MEEYYYESLVGQGTAGTSSGTAPVPTVEEAESPEKPYSPSEATGPPLESKTSSVARCSARCTVRTRPTTVYTRSPNLHHPDYGGDKYEEPSPAMKHPNFD